MGYLIGFTTFRTSHNGNLALAGSVSAGLVLLYLTHCILAAIYQLFFSPLRHIKGPRLRIAFPVFQHITFLRGSLDSTLLRLHQHYGHAVRIGPNEISFNNAKAWDDIYGHGKNLPKASFFDAPKGLPEHLISANSADHTRYRKAMSNGFSENSIRLQEPLIKVHSDLFLARLRDLAISNQRIDMVKWLHLVTFDLIGDLAFGQSFGCLESSDEGGFVRNMFYFIKAGAWLRVASSYPLLKWLFRITTPKHLIEAHNAQLELAKNTTTKRMNNADQQGRGDFLDAMVKKRNQPGGLNDLEIIVNANILISAGAETSATTMAGTLFWLLKNPKVMAKVQHEVRTTFKSQDEINFITSTSKLPFMISCITEAMRRFPPLPITLPRKTPENQRTVVSGHELPPNVIVGVNQYSAYLDARNFHRPEEYIPERWDAADYKDPKSEFHLDRREVLQPFSVGPRNCIGRNLAYCETRTLLALLFYNFDMELYPESANWHHQKTWFWWDKPSMWLNISNRGME
ncbi:hypothetical protein HBI47_199000 [Parastagonospora nodorum]|nr:hypothetical protein HBI47_199000 [Parastagonospora nodorum]